MTDITTQVKMLRNAAQTDLYDNYADSCTDANQLINLCAAFLANFALIKELADEENPDAAKNRARLRSAVTHTAVIFGEDNSRLGHADRFGLYGDEA